MRQAQGRLLDRFGTDGCSRAGVGFRQPGHGFGDDSIDTLFQICRAFGLTPEEHAGHGGGLYDADARDYYAYEDRAEQQQQFNREHQERDAGGGRH